MLLAFHRMRMASTSPTRLLLETSGLLVTFSVTVSFPPSPPQCTAPSAETANATLATSFHLIFASVSKNWEPHVIHEVEHDSAGKISEVAVPNLELRLEELCVEVAEIS